jgi:hypothetical protein
MPNVPGMSLTCSVSPEASGSSSRSVGWVLCKPFANMADVPGREADLWLRSQRLSSLAGRSRSHVASIHPARVLLGHVGTPPCCSIQGTTWVGKK